MFDPMASLLEDIVRPELLPMRRAALRVWHVTLNRWVVEEDALKGFDTERLERLVDLAWSACREAIGVWDPRFALQSLRSLPPEVMDLVTQLVDDAQALAEVIRISTAAAATSHGIRWPKGDNGQLNWIDLDSEQLAEIARQAPTALGGCLGAARLVYHAQGWYRWAGKGKRLQRMPPRITPEYLAAIDQWDGTGIFLMTAPLLNDDPLIERSVAIYEARRDAAVGGRQSGLLGHFGKNDRQSSSMRMWYVGWRGTRPALPVHIPALNITFLKPAWYPLADFSLAQWIEELRPFDDILRTRLGLSCDELSVGLTALGLVVERQTQCGYLRDVNLAGVDALLLESPAEGPLLEGAMAHLASVLLRGTLRASVKAFITALHGELEMLRWPDARQLAEKFIGAFRGFPNPRGLPTLSFLRTRSTDLCVGPISLAWFYRCLPRNRHLGRWRCRQSSWSPL